MFCGIVIVAVDSLLLVEGVGDSRGGGRFVGVSFGAEITRKGVVRRKLTSSFS